MRLSLLFAAMLAVPLAACAGMQAAPAPSNVDAAAIIADAANVPPPSTYADATTMDESAAIAWETAVTVTAELAAAAVRANLVPTDRLDDLATRSRQARMAVRSVRAAYDAGNSDSYRAAVAQTRAAIDGVRAIIRGEVR